MKTFAALLAVSLISSSLWAQDSPTPSATPSPKVATLPAAPPAPDAAELTKLLKEFLAGASRNDPAIHDRFWAEDLIYTGSSGRRLGKDDILRDVREEAAEPSQGDDATPVFTAEDVRIQQYGTTAIVAFRLVGTVRKGDKTEVTNYLNSGTFLKRDGKWQAVNWQATKMPAEPEAKK